LGSRFHGLVSALSQGVPALATGWSHKYQMLFEDYGIPEGMLKVGASDAEIERKVAWITDDREQIQTELKARAEHLKAQSEQMWQQVFEVIDQRTAHRQARRSA